jgi:hypothetical protein
MLRRAWNSVLLGVGLMLLVAAAFMGLWTLASLLLIFVFSMALAYLMAGALRL